MCSAGVTMGLGVLSNVMGGMAQKRQADAEAAAYGANARVNENNARLARAQAESESEKGRIEEERFRKDTAQLRGKQVNSVAASGTEMTGSAAEILNDTKAIEEDDVAIMRKNTQQRKWGFLQEGQNYMQEAENLNTAAKNKKQEARNALTGSLLESAMQVGLQLGSKKLKNTKIDQKMYPAQNPSDYQHWNRNGYYVK